MLSKVLRVRNYYTLFSNNNLKFKNFNNVKDIVIANKKLKFCLWHFVNISLNSQASTYSKTNDISADLINWALTCNISFLAFSKLLKVLIAHGVENIPKSSKTLLKAKESRTEVFNIQPGIYVHCGLKKNLINVMSVLVKKKVFTNTKIDVEIFIDNLPLSDTNGLWAILGSIIGFKSTIFLIGAYRGESKPKDSNLFLEQFVKETTDLCLNGLKVFDTRYSVEIKRIICDAPAKAYILNFNSFSGYSSCTKCEVKGENVENTIVFPYISNLRTDKDFSDCNLFKNKIKSKLLEIPNFGVVSNMPLDYMHLVCLGVLKKLMSIWACDPNFNCVNNLYHNMIQSQPKEFSNRMKPIDDYINWSAAQSRQFLLYYGPVILYNNLLPTYYQNFLQLHAACRMLCMNCNEQQIIVADEILNKFIKDFLILYGKNFATHNIHGLYHLANDSKLHGTLDGFSAFPYEKFLKKIQYSIKVSRKKSLPQLVLKYSHEKIFNNTLGRIPETNIRAVRKKTNSNDDTVVGKLSSTYYNELKLIDSDISLTEPCNSYVLLKNGKLIQVKQIFKKKGKNKEFYIEGKEFLKVFSFYNDPIKSSKLNIFQVDNLSENMNIWPVEMIEKKCIHITINNEKQIMMALLSESFN